MAGNSHRHTRLVNYGRKRTSRPFVFRLWFIIPIAACLAFTAALILGNTLGEMADTPYESESTTTAPESPSQTPTHGSKKINGSFVTLRGIYDNTASLVSRRIPDDAAAVSFELFDGSGAPYYYSAVAESFGRSCGELTLKNAFKPMSERSIYTSVLFPSSLLTNTDPNKSAVISAYEATLACELWQAGADEIVVHFSSFGSSEPVLRERFNELIDGYIAAIRMQSEGLRVGIVLTAADLKALSGSAELERLCSTADFCAIDLTDFAEENKLTDTLLSLVADILRHEMRLILSESGKTEEYLTAESELLQKLGMDNLQYTE